MTHKFVKALTWLLREPDWLQNPDGTPTECCHCPFATPETFCHHAPNPADPGEGHYNCELLGRTGTFAIWGETPVCQASDWRHAARELCAVYPLLIRP